MNRVAGKTYLAEISTENESVEGEDFKLNRHKNMNRYRNMNRYSYGNRYKERNMNRDKNRNKNIKRESAFKLNHMEDVRSVSRSNDKFSLRLYDLLKNKEGNLLMSPFSVSAVMAMVSAGARGNTLTQIMEGFSFPILSSLQLGYQDTLPALKSTKDFTLETASTAFIQNGYSLSSSFQDVLEKYFQTSLQIVDFERKHLAARKINNWVKNITRDKIKDVIVPEMLDMNTHLVLVNAIYFKGDWEAKFDPKRTAYKVFYASPSTKVMVPMMTQVSKFQWAYLDTLSSCMVELPYKGSRIVMQVLLPEEKDGLVELEEKLINQHIHDLFKNESSYITLNIRLPKFKLEHKIDLKPTFIDFGMLDMFSADSANFSGIDGKKGLYISQVVQKAFIEVNEEGSEAAAATYVKMSGARIGGGGPKRFVANHPFVFYIRDKTTGMLLFQGRVVNPKH